MTNSVYLAGRWSRREEILGYAREFEAAGWIVTSRWLTDPQHRIEDPGGFETQRFNATLALHDFGDVLAANEFVLFTPGGRRGGCWVELGIALQAGKGVAIIGPHENVFTWHPLVAQFDDWSSYTSLLWRMVEDAPP